MGHVRGHPISPWPAARDEGSSQDATLNLKTQKEALQE
jgi:hypothetical protein